MSCGDVDCCSQSAAMLSKCGNGSFQNGISILPATTLGGGGGKTLGSFFFFMAGFRAQLNTA